MKKFAKMAVAAAIAGMTLMAQAALVVDDFTVGQAKIEDNTTGDSGVSSTVFGAGILGGWRDIYVNKLLPTADPGSALNLRVSSIAPGKLIFSEEDGVFGYGIVRWDGISYAPNATFEGGINATGLGGVSLSGAGSAFHLIVTSADAGFPFTLNVFTNATDWTELTLFSSGPGDYIIPFAAFAGGTAHGAGADFNNVGALEAVINTGGFATAVDLSIDIIDIPEPGTMALTGLALLGLGAIRRRKQA